MNCPSRTDNVDGREGWNQNPNDLAGTTREDFNGIANSRTLRRIEPDDPILGVPDHQDSGVRPRRGRDNSAATVKLARTLTSQNPDPQHVTMSSSMGGPNDNPGTATGSLSFFQKARKVLATFAKFVGPGFMVCFHFFIVLTAPLLHSPHLGKSDCHS